MNVERLTQLAEAWGGDLRRWPDDVRAQAEGLVAADPAARRALDDAAAFDAVLHAAPRAVVSSTLRDRVLASAIEAGLKPRAGRAFGLDRIVWFLGAGWAAAACAGVVAGVGLTSHVTADDRADAVLYQSTLTGVDDTEVLG